MPVLVYSKKTQGNVYCSAHTQVREMACKDGTDTVLIDTTLMEMIEKLFAKLNCKKYIISSGYRTPEYSVKAGGSRTDRHTQGKAVDACFYDKNGEIIPAPIVCCVAQDLGFNGIANISSAYKNVHLDMGDRTKPYLGDETKGTNSVTRNFYDYFGISKADVTKYTGEVVQAPVNYFPKFIGTTASIVTALNALKITSSFAYRKQIAVANGISGYSGTAVQNTKMLNLLKQGKLIKP